MSMSIMSIMTMTGNGEKNGTSRNRRKDACASCAGAGRNGKTGENTSAGLGHAGRCSNFFFESDPAESFGVGTNGGCIDMKIIVVNEKMQIILQANSEKEFMLMKAANDYFGDDQTGEKT